MEREFDPALDQPAFREMALEAAGCADLYRVDWHESFLSQDGTRLTCCFTAPDAESVRQMVRNDASQSKTVWPATIHRTEQAGAANVLVERRFDEPVTLASVQAIEDAANACLQLHKVTFLRTYFSRDHKRMVCLYHAPDAESVRWAQQQASMPLERVWACRNFSPDNF